MKDNKGITLVALVITIIVLLILAGVTIALVVGNNGILSRADDSKKRNDYAQGEEEIKLAQTEAYTDKLGNVSLSEIADKISELYPDDTFYANETDYNEIKSKDMNGRDYFWVEHKNGYKYKVTWNGVGDSGDISNHDDPNFSRYETNIVQTNADVLIKRKFDEGEVVQQLTLASELESGGSWHSKNSSIAQVDNEGNVTWKDLGTTKIAYVDQNGSSEIFEVECVYWIPPLASEWNKLIDLANMDNNEKNAIGIENNASTCYLDAEGGRYFYHLTGYKTVDLTGINTITATGIWSWGNTGRSITKGSQMGIMEDDAEIIADFNYDEDYYWYCDVPNNNSISQDPITIDVSNLSGEHTFGWTCIHPDIFAMTYQWGYSSIIFRK